MSTLRGRQGEAMAAQYLRKHGYDVIAAGYHSRFGEIDLIARKRKQIVFVEVKLRGPEAIALPIHQWIDAVVEGTPAPSTIEEAVMLTRLMDGAYKAAESGVKFVF